MSITLKTVAVMFLLQGLWGCGQSAEPPQASPSTTTPPAAITMQQAEEIFDYAYPMVIMKLSQDVMFTVPFRPRSRPNHFIMFKRLAMPQNKAVVLGNRNTLYSVGWVDLSKGPVLFEIPDMGERYYVMPLLDAWTNTFRSLGSRTTGQGAQQYALVNKSWSGDTPTGYEVIVSPTNMVWITGRIQADDPQDALAAGILQDQYRLSTAQEASGNGDPFANFEPTFMAIDVKKPVPYSLQMPAAEFYDTFSRMWANNASAVEDASMVALLSKAGMSPNNGLSFEELGEETRKQLTAGLQSKQSTYLAAFYKGDEQKTPWIFNRERMGIWGTDYTRRAYWAMWGLGANLVEDAIYGVSQLDSNLAALDGSESYKLHFNAEDIPPTSAFWSVTAYDKDGYLEANEQQRYSLGSNHDLMYNPDGSVDLYLSQKRPADENHNWVPSPKGNFKVLLRIYWPTEDALGGEWQIPPLEKI